MSKAVIAGDSRVSLSYEAVNSKSTSQPLTKIVSVQTKSPKDLKRKICRLLKLSVVTVQ